MSKQRRTFSPEFKQQAACLVLDQGYSHMEASRSVGVGETVLRRWVQQLQMERQHWRSKPKKRGLPSWTASSRQFANRSLNTTSRPNNYSDAGE